MQKVCRRSGFHHLSEVVPVDVRGPDFEIVVLVFAHGVAIACELQERLAMPVVATRLTQVTKGFEKELESRKTLLAIDDRTSLNVTSGLPYLIQYDSAKKVGSDFLTIEQAFGETPHVMPQRLPLVFLVPHVGPLE